MCGQRCFCCNMSNWIWQIWERICIWSSGQYNSPSPPTKGWNWPFGRIVKQLLHTRHMFQPTKKRVCKMFECFTIFTVVIRMTVLSRIWLGDILRGIYFFLKKCAKLFWYGLHKLFFTHLAQGPLSPSCEHWITLNILERFEYLLSQQPVDSFPNQN